MRRTIVVILVVMILAVAIMPALADGGTDPAPKPDPLYIVLEDGQYAYILCAPGMHMYSYGKQSGAAFCGRLEDADPTR